MKISCNIIRDILPLYVDDVVSGDTRTMVGEHLRDCEGCRKEAEKMKEAVSLPPEVETKPLKSIKRKWKRKKVKIAVIASAVTLSIAALVSGYLILLCNRPFVCGFPVESGKIEVLTGIEYYEHGYLEQRFFIYFNRPDGKSLQVSLEDDVIYDENGHPVTVGYIIELREVPLDVFVEPYMRNETDLGYTYGEETPPSEDFDFTLTVKFKDKTTVYSMREEGLFEKQEILDVCPDWLAKYNSRSLSP